MELTEAVRLRIDAMSYMELLRKWRFDVAGEPIFEGKSGEYFAERMKQLRAAPGGDDEHVRCSKAIGWDR